MFLTLKSIFGFGLLGLSFLALLVSLWYAAWVIVERLIPWLRCWLGIADQEEYELFEKFAELREKRKTEV